MRVSIVIPTFNRAVYLEGAISSALEQDYPDLEVIIADNNSNDNTELVSRVYSRDSRIKYYKNAENIGMVRNWQKALLERITGEWFLILSDDDILTSPRFISDAVKLIKRASDLTVVYSSSYVYDEGMNTVTKLNVPFAQIEDGLKVFSKRGTVRPQDFALCNVLFNKRLAIEIGAFSNEFNLSCDTELFLHLCLKGRVGVVKDWCSIYRVHSDNLLKSVNSNTNFVIGSLDSLIKPLLQARHQGVAAEKLEQFVNNSGLRKEVIVALLKTSVVDKDKARAVFSDLQRLLKDVEVRILPSGVIFWALIVLSRALRPLFIFRRRLLYLLNAFKRTLFGSQIYFEPLRKQVYIID